MSNKAYQQLKKQRIKQLENYLYGRDKYDDSDLQAIMKSLNIQVDKKLFKQMNKQELLTQLIFMIKTEKPQEDQKQEEKQIPQPQSKNQQKQQEINELIENIGEQIEVLKDLKFERQTQSVKQQQSELKQQIQQDISLIEQQISGGFQQFPGVRQNISLLKSELQQVAPERKNYSQMVDKTMQKQLETPEAQPFEPVEPLKNQLRKSRIQRKTERVQKALILDQIRANVQKEEEQNINEQKQNQEQKLADRKQQLLKDILNKHNLPSANLNALIEQYDQKQTPLNLTENQQKARKVNKENQQRLIKEKQLDKAKLPEYQQSRISKKTGLKVTELAS